jgi:hypothetical protein
VSIIEHFKAHKNLTALDRRAVAGLIDSMIYRLQQQAWGDTPALFV